VLGNVAGGAGFRHFVTWPGPIASHSVARPAVCARMLARKREAKLFMFDSCTMEGCSLCVTLLAIARLDYDWMARHVTVRTTARVGSTAYLAVLVAVDAGLVEVFALELQLGVLAVLRPASQHLPAQGLSGVVAHFAFVTQFWPGETVGICVAALAVRRQAEEARTSSA
jgi:hypothetical protein